MQTDTPSPAPDIAPSLAGQLVEMVEKCTGCGLCQKECAFLKKYGTPKDIAKSYDPDKDSALAFECSLCNLCTAVCPFKVNPAAMFLEMRREAERRGKGAFPEHQPIRDYEKRGFSALFSYYGLPHGCDTVFFPGCGLPGTRPDKVIKLFTHLQKNIPTLGIVLDCCTKPSHDLGNQAFFTTMFSELRAYLQGHGVKTVIVACPNCYKVFQQYGGALTLTTAYEALLLTDLPPTGQVSGTVTVHDPCAVRFEASIHDAARHLLTKKGLQVEEMKHHHQQTICCGEGGSVGFLAPELSKKWSGMRKDEADGRTTLTYCSGCANYLNPVTPTFHLLDLVFEPEATMTGKAKISRAPFTYLNRLKLKRYFRKHLNPAISRERPAHLDTRPSKGSLLKRIAVILLLVGAIVGVRSANLEQYLDQDKLRQLIQGYGALGPLVFMGLYAITPCLFLPGLPFTIAAGILFGPVWGVVYAICGATIGATLAFLLGRYAGRDWVKQKLSGPRWKQLDQEVEKHGWKVVAFTRLIPLFPYNLLNFAFGLTGVKLLHYIVASFIFMLPACIAYILLSSSLLEALRGRISPAFIIGLLAVILVSSIPFFYNRYKKKKDNKNEP
ncbi:MAG: VTT domain-containing protein [Desulfobulbaceae bacterium]|nr:VTT domain-containing protein [Desulfobulbaceae bacterium]